MPTCRTVIKDALRQIKVLAPGDEPHIDELNGGLSALANLFAELSEARGPLLDVDITAATYIPGENQRIRVQSGDTATVTLPNAVPLHNGYDPADYGFNPAINSWNAWPPQGTTAAADNVTWRQPRDGARIEIVGTTQGLYFYRADTNAWMPAYGLTLDSEIPLNQRYAGPLGTLLAERLSEEMSINEPSVGFARRVALAQALMMLRPGTARDPVRAEYF